MIEQIHVLSLGAGIQSTTMALLAVEGAIKPMPSFAVFADTGDEPEAVYVWLEKLIPMLPFPVHKVMSHHGKLSDNLFKWDHSQIPAFMPGAIGKRQCTEHFKRRPIRRALRELTGRSNVIQWIGISVDEVSRAKDSDVLWITNRHPLLELRMRRQECEAWLNRRGITEVPKSACTYCPYHSDWQWRGFKQADGKEWAQIVAVDKLLNARGEFLHSSCKPIYEVDLSTEEERGQGNLFNNECEGMCGV
jgi:hypothetical protein